MNYDRNGFEEVDIIRKLVTVLSTYYEDYFLKELRPTRKEG